MSSLTVFLFFLMGLFMIIKGGDWFVESAVWLAKAIRVPNVLIGATVVSVATTLPELVVSSVATYQQYYDVAIGNVVGSIVCNIGLILGLTAILAPIEINRTSFMIKSVFMLFCCGLFFFLVRDLIITSKEGNIFIILFIIYIIINFLELKTGDREYLEQCSQFVLCKESSSRNIMKFILGAIFITLGARLLVDNGIIIAHNIGVPEQIVSLTLIALGTSLPELITAVSSIAKGHQEISVGNIIGANILDIVLVLGVSSKINEEGIVVGYENVMLNTTIYNIPQALYLDIPVALLMMIIIVLGGFFIGKINRFVGFLILTIYGVYLAVLAKLFL